MNISVPNPVPVSGLSKNNSRRFVSRHHPVAIFAALAILFCLPCAVRAQSPLDGFDPKANNTVRSIVVQADGKILIGGFFTSLSPNGGAANARNNIARLNPDGTLDTSFNPNANSEVTSIAVQADGKILIGGFFSTLSPNMGAAVTRIRMARLNTNGTVDASFNPKANGEIRSIVVQAGGKILIGGDFTTLSPNGGATVTRKRIARLNPNGTLDASFDPSATGGTVFSIVLQADGKILIGGFFSSLSPNGGAPVTRNRIARLNTNGTVDASFNPNANSDVRSIAVQADRKIVIGGHFTTLSPNGGAAVTRNRIARLKPDGTLDAPFNPNIGNNVVYSIAVQADGKIVIGGFFTTLSPNGGAAMTRNRIARLNPDGKLDASFNPNANSGIISIALQEDGKILIAGIFLSLSPNGGAAVTRNRIARLERDGTLDQTLNLNDVNIIFVTAVQPDGKILIGGNFDKVLGVTRHYIARLNSNGTLDALFNPNLDKISASLMSLAVQADGKILIGGDFTSLSPNGGPPVKRNGLARLNPNGTVDTSFDPTQDASNSAFVESIAVQADGEILIGGGFESLSPNGGPTVKRNHIARLNPDGTLDALFDPNASSQVSPSFVFVNTITVQADGKILIGGVFSTLSPNGGPAVPRNNIARLNSDGTVDASFDPSASGGDLDGSPILSIAVQADRKIVIGGEFTTLSPKGGPAVTRNSIARLNPDGTPDALFDPNASGSDPNLVYSIAMQADGKILIGGVFATLSPNGGPAITRPGIARVNANGTLDAVFDANLEGGLHSVTLQADGKILIGGSFTILSPDGGAAMPDKHLARLLNNTAALQNLAVTKTTITWTRGGASPQLERATFEQSTDGGIHYTFLGNGARVGTTSNFSLSGLNLPAGQNILIRARGFYSGGSITESIRNAYLF